MGYRDARDDLRSFANCLSRWSYSAGCRSIGMPLATGRKAASLLSTFASSSRGCCDLGLQGGSLEKRFAQTSFDSTSNKPDSEAEGSALQRKELFFRSLEVTAKHPLLGIGPGNFPIISGIWHVTHNSYTQISAEGGIPAFVLYLLIFWRASANLSAVRKYSRRLGGERTVFDGAGGESFCVSGWIFLWQRRIPSVSLLSWSPTPRRSGLSDGEAKPSRVRSAATAGSSASRGSRLGLRLGFTIDRPELSIKMLHLIANRGNYQR